MLVSCLTLGNWSEVSVSVVVSTSFGLHVFFSSPFLLSLLPGRLTASGTALAK